METSGQDHPAPSWRFAPTGGEQGNNPGQAYFANNALAQMVRETLQNSLDHPEPGQHGPVRGDGAGHRQTRDTLPGRHRREHHRAARGELADPSRWPAAIPQTVADGSGRDARAEG